MGRYATSYPGPKTRRLSPRAGGILWALSAIGLLGLAYLLYRGYGGHLSSTKQSDAGAATATATGAGEGAGGDGSELLREQQEQPGVPARLAGIAQKPRPPGWPFDPMDYPKPKTFFDISIDGKFAGRIVFELFTKQAPELAENFRALCTGERGRVPLAGIAGPGAARLHYKGAKFYRVIRGFICQTGINTPSIFGRPMADPPGGLKLKHDKAPRAAENFRALCTGEKGRAKIQGVEEGPRLHYKGAEFYRVIDRFICQTGIETPSIYGGDFDDDPGALELKHDKKGLLSAANIGPNTTTTHFSIVVAPAPHLNGHYPIFGQVVGGMDVVDRINSLAKPAGSKDERPKLPVVVTNCGELICDEAGICKEITMQER